MACNDRFVTKPKTQSTMQQAPSVLIDQLFKTVEAIGIENTRSMLKNAQFEKVEFYDSTVETVVRTVCEHFDIPIQEIIFGNGRLNDRKHAIGFSVLYLKDTYEYDMNSIAEFLKKDIGLCHKYRKLVFQLNDKFKSDAKYKSIKHALDQIFCKKVKK